MNLKYSYFLFPVEHYVHIILVLFKMNQLKKQSYATKFGVLSINLFD